MYSIQESILSNFEQLDDHQERVLFYEKNSRDIFSLESEKQFYFTFHYIKALFQLGRYTTVLSKIDAVIEYTFINNVEYLKEGTFKHLLFVKAKSNAELMKFEEAIRISQQLVGIDVGNTKYHSFLEEIHYADLNYKATSLKFTVLVLIFTTSIFSTIYWFINYKGQAASNVHALMVTISPCILAVAVLSGAHLLNKHKARRKRASFVSVKERERKNKLD